MDDQEGGVSASASVLSTKIWQEYAMISLNASTAMISLKNSVRVDTG